MTSHKIIVGLGNPGDKYYRTRHNIGFRILDELAAHLGLTFIDERDQERYFAKGRVDDNTLLLLKPKTYMNESGRSVRELAHFFKVNPSDLFVISDDVALPLGEIRIREKGSAGGHKGLLSIQQAMGTLWYPRLRIGVGAPPINVEGQRTDLAEFVLAPFSKEEEAILAPVIKRAAEVALDWVRRGTCTCMAVTNTAKKLVIE